jgi:hypothetical protein
MRFAVRLWDLAKARDLTGFAQDVHWSRSSTTARRTAFAKVTVFLCHFVYQYSFGVGLDRRSATLSDRLAGLSCAEFSQNA